MQSNSTTIITGASGGIGQSLSRDYLAEGHNVVLCGRNADKLAQHAERLDVSERILCVAGDVRDPEFGQLVVSQTTERFGPSLKNLINNAGTFLVKPFLETTTGDMQPYLDLFRGTYFLSQAVVEQLRDQAQTSHSSRDNGSVVFISTMFAQGFIGQFPCSAVGAIKAAYSGLTRNVCQELAAYGIRVNTVDLGVIETSIYGLDENGLSALRKMQPLEINGKPEDVSETVRHLTERSPFTTGQIVTMDGGVTAGHYAGSC